MATKPRELVAIAPRQPVLREYVDRPLEVGEVRIKTKFGAPKHGTELGSYRGTGPFVTRRWDRERHIFLPRAEAPAELFPLALGNMGVGQIVEVAPDVTRFVVGDRVFGHLPLRETHTVSAERVERLPEGMSPAAAVCLDPAEFALGAVRDAHIRLGDRVAVFGLGAIGLLVVQMVRLSGAQAIFAVDPIAPRRELAQEFGATEALDPAAGDVGLAIRDLTGGAGADVAIEASGAYPALHEAIRCVQYGGTVVPLAFYVGEAKGLRLGEEWHMNRINLVSARTVSEPIRDYPLWDRQRILALCFDMLREGTLVAEPIVCPRVAFDQVVDAYRDIDEHPERSVKLGVIFS
ncbi:MAG: zinc-binding alcohol dehydrogenase [Chloroflexi bacterium]|nr:zinc-binding alcohol dehydrogenase [Chloroflexota bacterium]